MTPAVVCPTTCSVVVRQQVGPGLGGGRVRMLRFTPLPCRPLRLRPRKCLYVAALHTSPLPANARRH